MLVSNIKHPSHPEHSLKLDQAPVPFHCDGCRQLGWGGRYQCNNCNFHLHIHCALPRSHLNHRFFESYDFEFHQEPPHPTRFCDACLQNIEGFAYWGTCKGGKPQRNLHACCANLRNKLTDNGNNFTLKLTKELPGKCFKCLNRKYSRAGVESLGYASACSTYCLHVACAKDFFFENWQKVCFAAAPLKSEHHPSDAHALVVSPGSGTEIFPLPTTSTDIVPRPGRRSKLLNILNSFLHLLFSAIFGDPVTFTAAIFEMARSLLGPQNC